MLVMLRFMRNLRLSVEEIDKEPSIHGRGGGLGGLDPPQNPKYPTQTRCLGKILTKKRVFKAFLRDFQTCLRHFSESCPTQIFGAAHVWSPVPRRCNLGVNTSYITLGIESMFTLCLWLKSSVVRSYLVQE